MFRAKDAGLVPTVYSHNQQLEEENVLLRKDLENYKLAAKYVGFNETLINSSK